MLFATKFSRVISAFIFLSFCIFFSATSYAQLEEKAQQSTLEVYKSPSCGCCNGWVEHLNTSGFHTKSINTNDMSAIKNKFGVDARLRSCHTGIAQGYVFEGHVPPTAIKTFLANPPEEAIGLSVPGMPIGSPGMEDGDRFQPYKVWLLRANGEITEFLSINSYDEQF